MVALLWFSLKISISRKDGSSETSSLFYQQESPPVWTQEAHHLPCSKYWRGKGEEYLPWGTPSPTPSWPGLGGEGTYLGVYPVLTWPGEVYLPWSMHSPILTWLGGGVPTLGYPLIPVLTWPGRRVTYLGLPTPSLGVWTDKVKLLPSPSFGCGR